MSHQTPFNASLDTPSSRLQTCLGRAGRPALGTVQEVFPQQVLRLRLVASALRVLSPQTGTSGAAAGARLGNFLSDSREDRHETICLRAVSVSPV